MSHKPRIHFDRLPHAGTGEAALTRADTTTAVPPTTSACVDGYGVPNGWFILSFSSSAESMVPDWQSSEFGVRRQFVSEHRAL